MIRKTLIIAEAGVNHNGDIRLAKQLIDVAKDAGADIVKFQTFKAEQLATHEAVMAAYQIANTSRSESQYEMLKRLELTEEMHEVLIAHCNFRKISFLSTGFDIESIDYLEHLGQRCFKIPSGEITNFPYLKHIGKKSRRIILSSGMSSMQEIEAALKVIEEAGTPRSDITVLHCTTEYPAPMCEVNLLAMQNIRSALGVSVGYSDHTLGIEVATAAVALGATVIEKHFTISRNLSGPDHIASLEPDELKAMVKAIRNIEVAMGNGIKEPTPGEIKNKNIARKSIVASKLIKAGEIFSCENITAKRPGNGINPMRWEEIIGQVASRDFLVDEMIEL